jgi:hypothetical protein
MKILNGEDSDSKTVNMRKEIKMAFCLKPQLQDN